MPASKPPATRSKRPSLVVVTSSTTSGYSRANRPSFGASTIVAASGDTTKRTRPAGWSRSPDTWSSAPRMSPRAGRRRAMSCSPPSVGATLRVVLASRRTPICSSSPRIAWLRAEGDTPSRFAARVKLRSSATARKAERTLSSSRTIYEWYSQTLVDFTNYSGAGLQWDDTELVRGQLALGRIAVEISLHIAGCHEVVVIDVRRFVRFIAFEDQLVGNAAAVAHR